MSLPQFPCYVCGTEGIRAWLTDVDGNLVCPRCLHAWALYQMGHKGEHDFHSWRDRWKARYGQR